MKKLGLVIGGYLLAFIAAAAVVWVHEVLTEDPSQASAGMAAFGDVILFVFVLGFLMLFPSALAVYFLLGYPRAAEPQ